jgi:hypothetical protein
MHPPDEIPGHAYEVKPTRAVERGELWDYFAPGPKLLVTTTSIDFFFC